MELLLLVLLAVPSATGIKELSLDVAPDAFDDQYWGCRDEMLKALPKLNRSEFATNGVYARAWAEAAAGWGRSRGSLLRQDQGIALRAFAQRTELYEQLNRAVPRAGSSPREYLERFDFKVLHFLLTTALEDLHDAPSHPRCLHVFRGVDCVHFTAQPGDVVRFGHFASSSLNQTVAEGLGTDTLLELDTCHGARIREFSDHPEREEVLIPPFETFSVTSVTRRGDKPHILLRSLGVHSKHNCVYASGGQQQWPKGPPTPRGAPPGNAGPGSGHRHPLSHEDTAVTSATVPGPAEGSGTEPPVSPGRQDGPGGTGTPRCRGTLDKPRGRPP
ncbi:erythroblast NAD(P)(+)--arginine ADP-ribosyltransferase-like [Chiroxiphia lanceolata]|uniref:erythroblast NAD(P)(+)--arginine ADP-ribosyltransferase-like n=1 Tax=Chiroxiphia lanceolata TaxID=296741 RepID=UPI0013CE4E7D|nr:erythroblast NAD(P)(+)--arginine ADP-ribosyltransferase-like [Chiroxiphia lanceolata]XP_032565782.1 erythroblast NAD(P)(+)--arginine ADP-ribosyltransferase-like [Chiroxiphia lanceolata]